MRTVEENREYLREYREKNADRVREIRRESARKLRAILYANRPPLVRPPKKVKAIVKKVPKPVLKQVSHAKPRPKKLTERKFVLDTTRKQPPPLLGATFQTKEYVVKSKIELCTNCARRYLEPLGCLFCKHIV